MITNKIIYPITSDSYSIDKLPVKSNWNTFPRRRKKFKGKRKK